MVPPPGWRVQTYPKDPRGKAAFLSQDCSLRVIVNPAPVANDGALVSSFKNSASHVGVFTSIERVPWGSRQGVRRIFEYHGHKLYYIDLVDGKAQHSLAFSALAGSYERCLPLALESMKTYEPLLVRSPAGEPATPQGYAIIHLAPLLNRPQDRETALDCLAEVLALPQEVPIWPIVGQGLELVWSGVRRTEASGAARAPAPPPAGPVKVKVNGAVQRLVRSWDKNIWVFTSESDPLNSVADLKGYEIACWGAEHMDRVKAFRRAVGVPGDAPVRVVGTGNPVFSGSGVRLFITWKDYASDLKGGVRVEFIPE